MHFPAAASRAKGINPNLAAASEWLPFVESILGHARCIQSDADAAMRDKGTEEDEAPILYEYAAGIRSVTISVCESGTILYSLSRAYYSTSNPSGLILRRNAGDRQLIGHSL